MSPLLRRASRRHLTRHPWQTGLLILGVSLGVAVVVAVDLANSSARRAFELSTEALTGRATHRVEAAAGGVPQEVYSLVRKIPGVEAAAPVVEAYVVPRPEPERILQLLGVDPFAEAPFRSYLAPSGESEVDLTRFLTRPGAVVLAAATASRLELEPGDRWQLEIGGSLKTVELVGLLSPRPGPGGRAAEDLVLADIATAQELIGGGSEISSIDLILPPGDQGDRLTERLRAALPDGLELGQAGARAESAQQMTRAFRLNLHALSLLALLCGAFLIYNTMTFSVVQRRELLGRLRALGVTRREIFLVVLGEALLLGLVGSMSGLLIGVALGSELVDLVTRTINDLYFVVSVRRLELGAWSLSKGVLLGLTATLAAAAAPAWEATASAPRAALARQELETLVRRAVPRVTLMGLALMLLGGLLLALPVSSLIPSFGGLFTLLVGCAFLTPLVVILLMRLLTPVAGLLFGQTGRMATRGVVAALSRTAVAVAALTMAVAVTVGVDLMIRSFRSTVVRWLEYSLPADLYLSVPAGPGRRFSVGEAPLGPALQQRLTSLPGVERLNTLRHFQTEVDGERTRAIALDIDSRSYGAFSFLQGDADSVWEEFQAGRAVIVSEPLAYRRGLEAGSELALGTPAGPLRLPVAGVFTDYSSEQGLVMVPAGLYRERWGDASATAASIHAVPGTDVDHLADRVRGRLGEGRRILVRSHLGLRQESMAVFDRTFVITGVLRLLAVLVAFVGVLSALMALQLERSRELGVLRACGLTPGELWRLVTTQTGLLGLTAGLLSLPVGVAMAAVMIFVINRRSFGWTLKMEVAPEALGAALALALGAALLAGIYPAHRMARARPAEALRGE